MLSSGSRLRYKGMTVNMLGLPVSDDPAKKKHIPRVNKRQYLRSFVSCFTDGAPKNLLLIYDIPEGMKKERDWFRRQLINFDFVMIQKSVWIGPSPLPAEFVTYLQKIGLKKEFKTFKLVKPYNKPYNK